MREVRLGEFEEVILLLVGILGEYAYSLRISEEYEAQSGRSVSVGAVHASLHRLSEKGLIKSEMTSPTAERGGRRKRVYTITAFGEKSLKEIKDFRLSLWSQYPGFSTI
ncbi:MAG: PadR family transcriptional regulator [Candidatus Cyclobacteriaceae bacterium M2_1C_046]